MASGNRHAVALACSNCVHVAVALRELPLISTAFGDGRIGYPKVRALVRIATPDNEQELLRRAEKLPVHVFEQEIARMRVRRDHSDENGSREPSKAGFRDAGHVSAPKNGSREPESACSCEHGHTADARHDDTRHDDTRHEAWLSPGVSVARETARRLCCDAHVIPLLCHYHHTLVHEGRYGIEPVESSSLHARGKHAEIRRI